MFCSLSGEVPEEPVVSKLSGAIFEKRLIDKYIEQNGKDPVSGEDLTADDILPIRSSRIARPRPPTLTSVPALLSTFQNEWDALALETYNIREKLARTREELATALYQQDAAVRVIARLVQERDQARDALSRVTVSAVPAEVEDNRGDAMVVDTESLSEELQALVDETQTAMSKTRKKRPAPEGWASAEDIAAFSIRNESALPVEQISTLAVEGEYAAVGGLTAAGDVAIYSVEADKVERQLQIGEPVTDTVWAGTKIVFGTSAGSVKVFDDGKEVAAFHHHAGPTTGVAVHPSGVILASVGSDKSIVFYDLIKLQRVARTFTDSALTTCAFHPDGHIFAAGTSNGEIKLFLTKKCEQAASFPLGAPLQNIAFSENGYWFAATGKGQTTVTIFDIRKEGDKVVAKVLDVGAQVEGLAWDYSQQFLATVGPAGMTVQRYSKGNKKWTELTRKDFSAVRVQWGGAAKKLIVVGKEGKIGVFSYQKEPEQ